MQFFNVLFLIEFFKEKIHPCDGSIRDEIWVEQTVHPSEVTINSLKTCCLFSCYNKKSLTTSTHNSLQQ